MKKILMILAVGAVFFAGCKKDEDPFLTVGPQTLSFEGEASAQTAVLKSNVAWTATSNNDWFVISPMSGTGDATVKVTVIQNDGMDRSGVVTFSGNGVFATLTVNQTGYPTISASVKSLEFDAKGGEQQFSISTNKDWTVSAQPEWAFAAPTSGNGSAYEQIIKVTVDPFHDGAERTGTLRISIDGASVDVSLKQTGDAIEYGGVTYKTVTLKDGRTWMAEPLRYIPSGKTPSSDPNDRNGIWYSYTVEDGKAVPTTGAYLYDFGTALGAEITSDNYKSFEGAQGICPEGWHIPTRAEFMNLVGASNSAIGETGVQLNEDAAYYDSGYKGGKITSLNADGFNWSFLGFVLVNNPSATGSYNVLLLDSSNCSVEDFFGNHRLNYMMCSTAYNANASTGAIQFFALMNTFTTSFSEGKLSLAYANNLSGVEVRCIKDE